MVEYKFGEMDSAEEINLLAENLANEGDVESLSQMAEENGIEDYAVDAYLRGEMQDLCTERDAAFGKIEVEEKDLNAKGLMKDWIDYLKGQIYQNIDLAIAVRRKGKSIRGMLAKLLTWSFQNQYEIPKEIIKEAKISASKVTFGVPDMGTAKRLIREYYLEDQEL